LCITKAGGSVTIAHGTGRVAKVIIADIKVDNGVIQVIDKACCQCASGVALIAEISGGQA
jgi:uncharacterized surface protein with fasciclin (FAS1) repeats